MTADEKTPARISHRLFTTSYLEMRIEMIKLVASDLDGTLLLNGAQSVEDSMFETIGKLLDRGILFAPASGSSHRWRKNWYISVRTVHWFPIKERRLQRHR